MKFENLDNISKREMAKMTKAERENIEHKIKKTPEWKLEEVCQYLNNKRLKPVLKHQDITLRPEGKPLTLQRIIGHKEEIPGAGQWTIRTTQEKDGCWHCDNWMYTLIFWHPEIGEFNKRNSIGINA